MQILRLLLLTKLLLICCITNAFAQLARLPLYSSELENSSIDLAYDPNTLVASGYFVSVGPDASGTLVFTYTVGNNTNTAFFAPGTSSFQQLTPVVKLQRSVNRFGFPILVIPGSRSFSIGFQ